MTDQPPTPALNVTCKDCGQPMVERQNHQNGSRFLGCSDWPKCTHTEPVPAYVHMIRAGATQLPGFDGA